MTEEYNADMDEYVKVAGTEGSEFMEFPRETDGSLLLSTVQSHFPNAIGLKYKASSGAFRGIRAQDEKFDAPRGGWGSVVYYVTESEGQKRKAAESNGASKKKTVSHLLQDIAVLGLPWTTTDDELKEYFEKQCGELAYSEVKRERDTGKSRGFGFIRFKTEECAEEALNGDHFLNGRKLDLRQKKDSPMKLFVGRIPSGTTKDDLWEYFAQFGDLKDTYIPTPFKGFGFVTFSSSEVGNHVLSDTHVFQGVRLNVDKGEHSKSFNMKRDGGTGSMGNYNQQSMQQQSMQQQSMQPTPPITNYTTPGYTSSTPAADPNVELKNMLFAFLSKQT